MGSFEVSFQGVLIFSKFKTRSFPVADSVIESIESFQGKSDKAIVTDELQLKSSIV